MPILSPEKTNFLSSYFSQTLANIYTSPFVRNLPSMSSFNSRKHLHSTPEIYSLFATCKTMDQLKQIHSQAIQKGLTYESTTCSKIIAFCCTCKSGDIIHAHRVFDTIMHPPVYIWNTMIKGYSRVNSPKYSILMYKLMLKKNVKPDNYTYPFLVKGFTIDLALQYGKVIHCHVCKFGFDLNLFVQHAFIHMYCFSNQINMARGVFNTSAKTDAIFWNEMISGYNKIKQYNESMKLFNTMEENQVLPTSVTLVSVLSACSELKDLNFGKRVHQYIKDCRVESSLILENALIYMYVTCGEMDFGLDIFRNMKGKDVISWTTIVKGFVNSGELDKARKYFDQMPEKDSVSWTAMIDGYLKDHRFKDVLVLFREMQCTNVKPDEFTMVSILTACANLGALELGEWIKAYIDKYKIKYDVYLGNAMIDMYFKCGDVEKAICVYRKMLHKDKFTWTNMILGFAINGHGNEALDMFSRMLRAKEKPDEITYIGVLCACTHTGLVNEGRKFFNSMKIEHGIERNLVHYGCMVDLLGKAGRLNEAYEVIKNMPMKPNSIIWGALLGACRVHKNVEMAEIVAKRLLKLEPDNGSVYVILCNIYAACKRWESLREVRKIMMKRGIKKTPGCSSIEINGVVHEFVAGDKSHPRSQEIYHKLDEMTYDLKLEGYLPDISEVFFDIREEEKENLVVLRS